MLKFYVVYDTVAAIIIGGVHLFRADEAATRMFHDIMTMKDSRLRMHPADYQLECIGDYDETTKAVTPAYRIVITGSQWLALQPLDEDNH